MSNWDNWTNRQWDAARKQDLSNEIDKYRGQPVVTVADEGKLKVLDLNSDYTPRDFVIEKMVQADSLHDFAKKLDYGSSNKDVKSMLSDFFELLDDDQFWIDIVVDCYGGVDHKWEEN